MKATGIVRRIDDLGRIVIPKEIRKVLKIREGEALEIFTARDNEIILKKYSPMGEMEQLAKDFSETLGDLLNKPVAITDRDSVLATSKLAKKIFKDKYLSEDLERLMSGRIEIKASDDSVIAVTSRDDIDYDYQIVLLIVNNSGDCAGTIIAVSDEEFTSEDEKALRVGASLLGKQIQ